jgi:Domain of unknown function (DUF4268)
LEVTDHRHLGQLLTHAAGLDAAIIVWVSPEVRDEHREAFDWLNRHTEDRIDFFGVSLEAIRIDGSKPAVQFRLVAFPNARSKKVTGEVSARNLRYQQFFQGVIDELRDKHRFTNARVAQPKSGYAFNSGTPGIDYKASFAAGGRLRAELYVNVGDAIENKSIFDTFHAQKDAIEQITGTLDWERLDQWRASRISLVRPNTSIDTAAGQADEMRAWLVQGLLNMKSAFGPRLVTLALSRS